MNEQDIGRIRKVTTPEGHTDYIMEFPKEWVMMLVPENPLAMTGRVVEQAIVSEWEQVSLVQLIHSLNR